MKFVIILLGLIAGMIAQASFGLTVEPTLQSAGQALHIQCAENEAACLGLCAGLKECTVPEAYCRSCAGTQNLKLKRLLDSVGVTLFTEGAALPSEALISILRSGTTISLHAATLYNFSGAFNNDQLKAQFRALCRSLPDSNLKLGTLLLSVDPETHALQSVLGALCPNLTTGATEFFLTANPSQKDLF